MCYKVIRIRVTILFILIGTTLWRLGYAQEKESGFQIIQERLEATLLADVPDAVAVRKIQGRLDSNGMWPSINYLDTSRTGFQHHVHLDNLLEMAKAYRAETGGLYRDEHLLSSFKKALRHWLEADYRCENWWWNEIGTPDAMAKILLLTGGELNGDELARGLAIARRCSFDGFGARPGGDFVKMAAIMAMTELVSGDTAKFRLAIETMAEQVYVTQGRGIKPDMSFHHRTDWVPSTLSYGAQYARTFAYWSDVLRDTRFAFRPPLISIIADFYLDGMRKAMPFGRFGDPGIKNRDVSRPSGARRGDDATAELLKRVTDYRKQELENPDLRSNQYFWYSHYHSHQRPGYFASVRMYSDRSNNIEFPHNEEGLKNHFYADGSLFITRTGREYINIYPSWDWRKIPGTTVVQVDSFPHWKELVKKGTTSFVGGVSDGAYGAASFDFLSPHTGLTARKSWFFFDREIVCLGTGIFSQAPYHVMTTLNQSLLNGPVWANGNRHDEAVEQLLDAPNWINHDSVGYVLLDTGKVWMRRGVSTGTWRSISHQASATDERVSQNIFTLAVDHGVRPKGASYAYMVVPEVDERQTADYMRNHSIKVVSNSNGLQAVSDTALGIHYAVFYEPGEVAFPGGIQLHSEAPGQFLLKVADGQIQRIAIADPTRKLATLAFRLMLPTLQDTTITATLPADSLSGKSLLLGPIPDADDTFLLRRDTLDARRKLLISGDVGLGNHLDSVVEAANLALTRGPYSVTDKPKVPPSGDKRDYMSVGPYWWPDTTKPDGLPYIRRDGETNPERFAITDAQYLKNLCADVQLLAVSYYFTQQEKYAKHAALLLETWFLNEQTRMNPNLRFGQAIPGITEGRGIGLIDSWPLVKLLDATQLLRISPHWDSERHAKLKVWVNEFLHWMLESDIGKDEADEHNNHGTYYDVQVVSYALFVGDKALARETLEQNTKARIGSQLETDGRQPHELARTKSWSYSLMNLTGFCLLARLGESVGVDLWNYNENGKGIREAFNYLLPYGLRKKSWEYSQIGEMDLSGFNKLAAVVGRRYAQKEAGEYAEALIPPFNHLTGSFL